MKKTVLSLSLIFIFSAYTLYVNIIGANTPVVLTPQTNKPKVALTLPKYSGALSDSNSQSLPQDTPVVVVEDTTPSTPAPLPKPVLAPAPKPQPVINNGKYRNGSYTGNVADAYYGNVQVRAIISGGKITDVQFLDYPQDRSTSVRINSRAMPYLISEAISLQDSNVNTVSGASFTSQAYRQSLSSALAQARV